ncbi:hypothetical protein R3W88_009755 [Solanum pinnatisectum]|uniref:ATPase F1/V1/A1 complex alpha/beta subunit N-terminal domain-containing protein n=1 Tax=Solanum pinnatisectum TaxID=50273 RepID=A0AAV9MEF2_9SOLN|nr:hypothetical protein R3W88_009755 [Solanum pinnatisectum]
MITIWADHISNIICEHIEQYNKEVKIVNIGIVLQVGDGIACIHDLDESTIGIAMNLGSHNVGVVLMGDSLLIKEGKFCKSNRKNLSSSFS